MMYAQPGNPPARRCRPRGNGRVLAVILLTVAVIATASCRTVIVPPAAPADPVVVHLLKHGRHTSLALPRADGTLVRYSYGDWRFYALSRPRLGEGAAALLWPTPACFGRREIGVLPPNGDTRVHLERQSGIGIKVVYPITVDRCAVDALQSELESLFESQRAELHWQPAHNMEFVPHPKQYHLLHNSNTMIARWLRQLDCEVRGVAILSLWTVKETP